MAKIPEERRTQAERREETRTRVLDAAVSELLDNGYAGFRVDKVACAAKVSRGAQSHHFPTKESLVLAALETLYQGSSRDSMKVIDSLSSESDLLDVLMEDSARFYLGPTFVIAMSLLNLGEIETELRGKVRAISRMYRLPVETAWLSALTGSGLDEESAQTVLNITQSVYRGMPIRSFLRDDPEYIRFTVMQWSKIARAFMDQHTRQR